MRPQLWIIAGPNGAGKSTISDRYFVGRIPVVNPDNVAFENPGMSERAAGKLAITAQNQLLASKSSFAWETTMSGNRVLRVMQQAKDAGYKINLLYFGVLNWETSLLRVATRVARGGHDVPNEDIVRRFQRSLDNLPAALKIADRAYVVDNGHEHRRILLSRVQDQTRRVGSKLPEWLVNALPASILRTKDIER